MSYIKKSDKLLRLLTECFTWEEVIANKYSGYIATTIELWRHKNNMNQKDFAKRIGVSRYKVIRWESGEHNFNLKEIAKLVCAKVLPEVPLKSAMEIDP